jgi:ABC-2 type transport system permease protein
VCSPGDSEAGGLLISVVGRLIQRKLTVCATFMRRIIAQARKELTQILRDRLALALALVLPLILLFLLGFAVSLTVTDMAIVVQDLDQTPLSRQYIDQFRSSLTFRVDPWPVQESPWKALEAGKARGVLIVPEHFEHDLQRGDGVEVQVLIDASDANTANLLRGSMSAISQSFLSTVRPKAPAPPINAHERLWYNPGRDSQKYVGPAVIGLGLMLFPSLLGALAMSREGEQKTILQVYVSSISAHEFLLGKILGYFVVATAEWVLSLVASYVLFGLRLAGDPTPFLVGTAIYLFAAISFGIMVGAAIPNQAAAIQGVQILGFLASFLLSGFIFPISNIPIGLRWISALVPARYFIEISRDAFLRGGGWPAIWYAPLMLAVLGGFFFFMAWRKMRRMQVEA